MMLRSGSLVCWQLLSLINAMSECGFWKAVFFFTQIFLYEEK